MLDNVIEDKKSSFNPTLNKYSDKILEIAFSYYFRIIEKELNGTVKVPVLSLETYLMTLKLVLMIRKLLKIICEKLLMKKNYIKLIIQR